MLEICFKIARGLFHNKNQLKHITFIILKLIGVNSNFLQYYLQKIVIFKEPSL